jgi:predicted nucleic acid-binding protein
LAKAVQFARNGIKSKDALHIACAIEAGCTYFLTTDDGILKKMTNHSEIIVLNPIDFIRTIE